ncbi:uncharacterized protein V1513DRAFT_454300 [Lipomyces chichibuensis]|uniref:uncharacterized protein n=1 Tax=Lipomyces chichibuensis TaxID=1546026 RepID=UPI003344369D
MADDSNGHSHRRNASTYGFEMGPYSTPDRVHSFAAIRTSNGAHYPSWCLTFFLFAIFQAIFAIIPLGVVAYFISLVRRQNMNAGVPQAYVLLISAATITSMVILVSTVEILYHFRNAGSNDSDIRNDECEDEGNMEVGWGTIDIDIQGPGYLWPFVFVLSQILMSLFWIGIFVYIMLISGGISTACAIPNADKMCTGLYKETCQSYVTVCHLGNLIVVSCALDACFWVSGTVSMFINSAITYRKRSLSGFSGIAEIFSSRQPTTSPASMTTSTVRETSRILRGSRSTPSAFWRLKKKTSSDIASENTIDLQYMSNSTTVGPNSMDTMTGNAATASAVGNSINPFDDPQFTPSSRDGTSAPAPATLSPSRNNGVSTLQPDSILSYAHRHNGAHTPHQRPSSSSYVQLHEAVDGGTATYPPTPARNLTSG